MNLKYFIKDTIPYNFPLVNLKYYLHKHILSTHSIDVALDEIKMKRDRKNKTNLVGTSKLLDAIKRKEKKETAMAYQASQMAKKEVGFWRSVLSSALIVVIYNNDHLITVTLDDGLT